PINYVYFSFAGLFEKRIERVELDRPSIKAGQPLFDFIDVTRNRFFAATTSPSKPMTLLAALDAASLPVQQALSALRGAEPKPAVWDIPIYCDRGSVITAPKG